LRKQSDVSQSELATNGSVSREIIGEYERDEAVPSIEAAKKMQMHLKWNYLVGERVNSKVHKKI
jgi:ribosome-binding protein aMBF1 (putative translation factor)